MSATNVEDVEVDRCGALMTCDLGNGPCAAGDPGNRNGCICGDIILAIVMWIFCIFGFVGFLYLSPYIIEGGARGVVSTSRAVGSTASAMSIRSSEVRRGWSRKFLRAPVARHTVDTDPFPAVGVPDASRRMPDVVVREGVPGVAEGRPVIFAEGRHILTEAHAATRIQAAARGRASRTQYRREPEEEEPQV